MNKNYLITTGGSGGHVIPAIILHDHLSKEANVHLSIDRRGLKFLDKTHGEFKSIRVNDKFRKKGNGITLINNLINEAKKLDIKKLSLETGAGKFFNPARKLFDQCGFKECDPFSHYKEDDNSVYMSMFISNEWR